MASVRKRTWVRNNEEHSAWTVDYKDANGNRRNKQFEKKKDADKFRNEIASESGRLKHVPESLKQTVDAICEAFMRHEEDRLRDGRISKGRHYNVKQTSIKMSKFFNRKSISELNALDFEDWYREMVRVDDLSPITARGHLFVSGMVMEFAKRRGVAKLNPVPDALKQLRGIQASRVRTFTRDEIATLLAAADVRRPKQAPHNHELTRCAVHLAVFCGLRWGEIMGLTLASINLHRRIAHVRNSYSRWDGLKTTKTPAGMRDVPLPPHIVSMLGAWLERHYVPNDRQLVFCSPNPIAIGPVSASGFHSVMWHPLLKQAGLWQEGNNFRFHALRHFAASWMIEQSMPLTEVASLLGHKQFDITLQVYAHTVTGGHARHIEIDAMALRLLTPPKLDAAPMQHDELTH